MDEPIFARYVWTADELLAGHRWHARQQPYWLGKFPLLIGLGFVAYGVMQFCLAKNYPDGFAASLPTAFAGCVLLGITKFIQPFTVRRRFAKRPDRDLEISWQFSADEVRVRNSNGGSEFKWQALSKAVQTPEGFLLYPNAQIFHWIPSYAFDNDTECQRLADLVRTRVAKFRKVT